jgi:hypothetical protein
MDMICPSPGLDLESYDLIIVAFSGGKDSIAALPHLIEFGIPPARIELWHHDVDAGHHLMDWEVTPSYCRAVAKHLEIPIYFSWREGGFAREMDRDGTPTAPVFFEKPDRTIGTAGGNGAPGTRGQFPQVSAALSSGHISGHAARDRGARAPQRQDDPPDPFDGRARRPRHALPGGARQPRVGVCKPHGNLPRAHMGGARKLGAAGQRVRRIRWTDMKNPQGGLGHFAPLRMEI